MEAKGVRVRVIKNDTDEPELVGLTGTYYRIEGDGRRLVFLDDEGPGGMPTRFPADELEELVAGR